MRRLFGTVNPLPNIPARYNIAPTLPVLTVRRNPTTGDRSLDLLRWGLIPHWAKDAKGGPQMINARAESLGEKPAFRGALAQRRCLIPADGFYEWQQDKAPKQPFLITLSEGGPFCFAGLWENWRQPDGVWLRSCAIITTRATPALHFLHHRMPVILDPADYGLWLGEETGNIAQREALLRPYDGAKLAITAVGTAVNQVRNEGPELIIPRVEQVGSP
jgi:putative SOS response-associated peptidase YedK